MEAYVFKNDYRMVVVLKDEYNKYCKTSELAAIDLNLPFDIQKDIIDNTTIIQVDSGIFISNLNQLFKIILN